MLIILSYRLPGQLPRAYTQDLCSLRTELLWTRPKNVFLRIRRSESNLIRSKDSLEPHALACPATVTGKRFRDLTLRYGERRRGGGKARQDVDFRVTGCIPYPHLPFSRLCGEINKPQDPRVPYLFLCIPWIRGVQPSGCRLLGPRCLRKYIQIFGLCLGLRVLTWTVTGPTPWAARIS